MTIFCNSTTSEGNSALSLHCHRETGDRENMKVSKKDISTNIRIPFTQLKANKPPQALNDGCQIRIKAYQKKKMLIKFQDSYCNYSHLLGIETMEAVFYFLRKETIPNFIEKNFNYHNVKHFLVKFNGNTIKALNNISNFGDSYRIINQNSIIERNESHFQIIRFLFKGNSYSGLGFELTIWKKLWYSPSEAFVLLQLLKSTSHRHYFCKESCREYQE
ncbi:hypothetical protein H8356DRAFT_1321087 [Neocallimastix lanati (nom. inval.)]|nr:hypothetical protein H8356DRAFT_1321087 [Neocallimastix sp. JGI-2020a]